MQYTQHFALGKNRRAGITISILMSLITTQTVELINVNMFLPCLSAQQSSGAMTLMIMAGRSPHDLMHSTNVFLSLNKYKLPSQSGNICSA